MKREPSIHSRRSRNGIIKKRSLRNKKSRQDSDSLKFLAGGKSKKRKQNQKTKPQPITSENMNSVHSKNKFGEETGSASKKRKLLKFEKRMQRNPAAEFIKRCNILFSKLTDSKVDSKEERQNKVQECLDFIHDFDVATTEAFSGKAKLLSVNRCLQMCYKYGTVSQREFMTNLLKPTFVQNACLETGSFLCIKMLKYSDIKTQEELAEVLFNDSLTHLAFTKYGSKVLDYLVNLPKPFSAEHFLKRLIFKLTVPNVASLQVPDFRKQTPQQIFSNVNDHGKCHMKEYLETITTRCVDKELVGRNFFHYVFEIFSGICTAEELTALLNNLQPCLTLLLATHPGCLTLCRLIDVMSAKERKKFIQSWKQSGISAYDICLNNVSSIIILKLLHTVDDTKLLRECVLGPSLGMKADRLEEKDSNHSFSQIEVLSRSPVGRKIILAILSDRQELYLSLQERSLLNSVNQISKKDPATRRAELLPLIGDVLNETLKALTPQRLVQYWMQDRMSRDIFVEYMKHFKDMLVIDQISQALTEPWSWMDLWDHSTAQRTLAQLVRLGSPSELFLKTSITCSSFDSTFFLSTSNGVPLVMLLWDTFNSEKVLNKLLLTRGVFILVDILKILCSMSLIQGDALKLFSKRCIDIIDQEKLSEYSGIRLLRDFIVQIDSFTLIPKT